MRAMLISCALATPVAAQQVQVPSGQSVTLNEVLIDERPGETWVRFRFIAPDIARNGEAINYDVAAPDMDHLCETLALAYLQQYELTPTRVVISLSDRVVPFGTPTPEATQFFEAYRPETTRCIWEEF